MNNTTKAHASMWDWLHRQFLVDRNNRFIGYLIFPLIALFSIWMAISWSPKANGLALLFILGAPLLLASIFNLKLGIHLIAIVSFFILGVKRQLNDLPVGIALDILTAVTTLGLMIKLSREKDWRWFKHPMSIALGIWMAYCVLVILNPTSASGIWGWLYTVRMVALQGLLFFVAIYAFDNLATIRSFSMTVIILSVLAAVYGIFQDLAGIPFFEMKWIYADPVKYELYFLNGRFRIFSFLSDPAIFGVMMAAMGVFSLVLATGPWKQQQKVLFGVGALLLFWAMVPSGTRTAYVVVPASLLFFSFMTMSRQAIILTAVLLGLGAAWLYIQPDSILAERVISAFQPNEDQSYQERLESQRFIQSYIQGHPVGSGLGTMGYWGQRFAPDTMLANFSPDSGYVRIAVELGWIGLLLFCALLFLSLKTGIQGYFQSRDPEIRNYYVAFVVMLMAMVIANYAQLVFTQRPATEVFFISLAALVRLKEFEFSAFQ